MAAATRRCPGPSRRSSCSSPRPTRRRSPTTPRSSVPDVPGRATRRRRQRATSGVARATALAFARRGAAVGLVARGPDGLAAAAREVMRAGGVPLALPCDVADADAVDEAAARAEAELGPVDVWVTTRWRPSSGRSRTRRPPGSAAPPR